MCEEQEQDRIFMLEALKEAAIAGSAGDVPVGAVVVVEGQIVSRGHNRREQNGDPTSHAEIEALRNAAKYYFKRWHIEGTLYVTQEPCPMCAGALVNARVKRLVYGCKNPKAGAIDSIYSIVNDERLNHRIPVTHGILSEECASMLQDFFRRIRSEGRKRPLKPSSQ